MPLDDEETLVARMVELASQFGRYGYRRITGLLRLDGWLVNHKWVERLWRREGLKVPKKQPKRDRLWLNDGSCVDRIPNLTLNRHRTMTHTSLKLPTITIDYSQGGSSLDADAGSKLHAGSYRLRHIHLFLEDSSVLK